MLHHKSGMKQDVYHRILVLFRDLKEVLQEVADDLEHEMLQRDKRVSVQYRDKGEMTCELKVAG
ncbi:MAG: hypothetical protein JNJ64_07120, partial [Flavobacteriales bacterium]|nr:hypothetical protein [Flavobacteriales bacterium]